MTYRYETHLHTFPVSACACASAEENVRFYKSKGYDGIFVSNHFIDSNIGISPEAPYEERIHFFYSDYRKAKELGDELGLKVFPAEELAYKGTDFLIYGLSEEWYLAHPEIEGMEKSEELALMRSAGALIIHAHPFREDKRIDHIRLYPRHVEGVEVINACRSDAQNEMARLYAEHYGLIPFAGSDNHHCNSNPRLAGIETDTPIESVSEFIDILLTGRHRLFIEDNV